MMMCEGQHHHPHYPEKGKYGKPCALHGVTQEPDKHITIRYPNGQMFQKKGLSCIKLV